MTSQACGMATAEVPNPLLRAHATGGFSLTLGTTHIAAMVYVDYTIRSKVPSVMDLINEPDRSFLLTSSLPHKAPWSHYVPGIRGVLGRGLLIESAAWLQARRKHEMREAALGRNIAMHFPTWRMYRFTKAGVMARGLLQECGVWQEFAEQLAAHQRAQVRGVA
jgi:hypothetical protein